VKTFWVSRDVGAPGATRPVQSTLVLLWHDAPALTEATGHWCGTGRAGAILADVFQQLSGLPIEPGTCRQFRLEEVPDV